ncbi:ABC transporter permease [Plantactinospora soyae]|uniref:ABC transport system permease protein n=1 Tax=Plantactinospora soyae TaxID=1544732 RepID=A0A927LZH3_9ACTN|nr:FtsX-like permease family protein [Plantactinospora soyae]MBE1485388.1 putative ABC transport system permease protein [Plantactinospora soyae]
MIRATLRGILSRRLRLILSGLAVVLGVMFVSGAFVLTDTLGRSFDTMYADVYADTGVRVRATPPRTESEAPATVTVPAGLVDRVAALPGAAGATGLVSEDGARMIGSDGKVVTTFGRPRLGTNWVGETGLTRLRTGRGPANGDEIAISAALADRADLGLGDRAGVLTLAPGRQFTVVGILEYGDQGRDSLGGAHEIAFHESVAAQLMLGRPGVFSAVDVRVAAGVDPVALRDGLRATLGADYEVRTSAELRREQAAAAEADLGFLNDILLGFAGVGLFVGVFLILNTFSIIIAQRTRELALLRALGASRRQVIGSVLGEAALIGLVASALGLVLGAGAGTLLARVVNRVGGGALDVAGFGLPAAAAYAAFTVGLLVTVLAALLPAVRAARIPPVAALQEAATPDRPLTRLTVAGVVIGVAGVALLGYALVGGADEIPVGPVLGGVLAGLVGAALLTPAVARPTVGLIGRLFSWSVPGRLGRLNSRRNPRRIASTAAALMVGIALVTGLNIVLTSATVSLKATAPEQIHADLVITWIESTERPPTFDRAVLDRIRAMPGVLAVVGRYQDGAVVDGDVANVTAIDNVPALPSMVAVTPVAGSFSLGPDQLLVDVETANRRGLRIGSVVHVEFGSGRSRDMTVAGTYAGDWSSGWYLSDSVVGDLRVQQPSEAYVRLAPEAAEADVRREIAALLADNPEIAVTDPAGVMDLATRGFDSILLMVQALLALAMVIAVLGIVNTLALSGLERTRELGLLRAIGLSRRQVIRMVTVEAVIISTFGALLGVVVGAGIGAAVVRALADEGVDRLALPWGFIAAYLLAGGVIGVVAAVLPAIRAARLDVLRALAYE